jgi:CRISPR/Cas system-associated exonuclease Cas4 (RecB family)
MKKLLIFPTSRALRVKSQELKNSNNFLPTLMRTDEFEHRAVVIPNRVIVDPIQRILLLQEASDFEAFKKLKVDKELIRFFSRSDSFFKFFEELAGEDIGFEALIGADAYVEFDEHIEILQTLHSRYEELLNSKALIDKTFIPQNYQINQGFITSYDQFELYLEGYLSHYELSVMLEIAISKPFLIHMQTRKFNIKMIKKFEEFGITLPMNSYVCFDLHSKEIIRTTAIETKIDAMVIQCEERLEQVSLAMRTIEEFVQSGISPEDIVLILADESMQEQFRKYDRAGNLNFAMGFSYQNQRYYKILDAIYSYWQLYDEKSRDLVEAYRIDLSSLAGVATQKGTCEEFFECILQYAPLEERVEEQQNYFCKLFLTHHMSMKNWLYLWLQLIGKITIDDVRGGKITVIGALESRGIAYEAVVIVDVNEGIVPVTSSKDRFLNTSVRAYAGLPTKADRESLQKYFYQRILEQAKKSVIMYTTSDNRLPSKFLYELGLNQSHMRRAELSILYNSPSELVELQDPQVELFDATAYQWSNTMLKSFIQCKRQFYYRYIKKMQTPQDDDINEGLILHEILERTFKDRDYFEDSTKLKQEFIKNLSLNIQEKESKQKSKDMRYHYYRILWEKRLEGFFEEQIRHFKAGWRVRACEYKATGTIGGLKFVGKIDRIDQDATHTLVLDYKTGSTAEANRTKNLENLSDFQMSIYHALLSEKGYINIELSFVKIFDNGKQEVIEALEEKNSYLAEHIIRLKQTKSFSATKCDNLQLCKFCSYTLNCERGEYV